MVAARKPKRGPLDRAQDRGRERAQQRDAISARLAIVEAEHAALRASLQAVLATLPNEWASAEVQAVRRQARAVVEETGKP